MILTSLWWCCQPWSLIHSHSTQTIWYFVLNKTEIVTVYLCYMDWSVTVFKMTDSLSAYTTQDYLFPLLCIYDGCSFVKIVYSLSLKTKPKLGLRFRNKVYPCFFCGWFSGPKINCTGILLFLYVSVNLYKESVMWLFKAT